MRFLEKLRTELSAGERTGAQAPRHHSCYQQVGSRPRTGSSFGSATGRGGGRKGDMGSKNKEGIQQGKLHFPLRMDSYERASFIPSQFGGN